MVRHTIPNPWAGTLRPVRFAKNPTPAEAITDRAKRYRAQKAIPKQEKRCLYCGAPASQARRLDVEHIDGHEANANPENLGYACRPCNTAKGALFARLGLGQRTRQYNPSKRRRAIGLGLYLKAVRTVRHGEDQLPYDEAVSILQSTTPAQRSEFAREVYRIRRSRQAAIPF